MEQEKEYYTKVVNYAKSIPVTKTSFHHFAANFYRLSLVCEARDEQDEALKYLDEAKRIAKVGGLYRNWMLLVVLLKLRKKYEEMGSLDKSNEYLREVKCVAANLNQDDVSTIIEPLKEAGKDLWRQVPALLKLGEWYLDKAKTTIDASDFTKADAIFNAALVRSRRVRHEIDEGQILRRIVETYREFLHAFARNDDELSDEQIRKEIDSHKEWVAEQRRIINVRVNEIDQNHKTKQKDEMYGEKTYEVFRDIQDMYVKLVTMLVKECEVILGKPPCKYAIISLGSVARMEATPFSDLEFAILHSDETIGNNIKYFRILSHFLHLKVINLGETILPSLAIKELNDFQSPDPNDNWFYDSFTPRGISFDGAMPWASKTALGRMATKNKPALELIRTPEHMAVLQDEEIAIKEGYHLAGIMSRVALLYGEQALLDEYNNHVAEKLNEKSPETKSTTSVGFTRGIKQIMEDVETHNPVNGYLNLPVGGLFDTKKHFYRLISLLLTHLGLVFDIRSPSPWQVILELRDRDVIGASDITNLKVCLSIANVIRLKTYFANGGQKELFSPLFQSPDAIEKSTDVPIFRDIDEDTLVYLLNTSFDLHQRCSEFCLKYNQEDKVDKSILRNPSIFYSKVQMEYCINYRLEKFSKALECIKSIPKNSPDYAYCANSQGLFYARNQEFEKAIECYESGLEHPRDPISRSMLLRNLSKALVEIKQFKGAKNKLEEATKLVDEFFGEGSVTIYSCQLMLDLGILFYKLGNMPSAIETLHRLEEMQKQVRCNDTAVISLNAFLAMSYSDLGQDEQSLKYVERTLCLCHKPYGEHDLSCQLFEVYVSAAAVYRNCDRYDEAISLLEQCSKWIEHGGTVHPASLIECLNLLGKLYIQRNQIDNASKCFRSTLEQEKKIYPGQPRVAETLLHLGSVLQRAGMLDEALECYQEGKEILDNHPEQRNLTSSVLNNIGVCHYGRREYLLAFQSYKDAFDILDVTAASGELYKKLCKHMANNVAHLSLASINQATTLGQSKEHKSIVDTEKKTHTLIFKGTCAEIVIKLYELCLLCNVHDDQSEMLKHLKKTRGIAKEYDYKCGRIVLVLLLLSTTYGKMGSIEKSRSYYEEAKEMAKSLPSEDDSILHGELGMIELMKK